MPTQNDNAHKNRLSLASGIVTVIVCKKLALVRQALGMGASGEAQPRFESLRKFVSVWRLVNDIQSNTMSITLPGCLLTSLLTHSYFPCLPEPHREAEQGQ